MESRNLHASQIEESRILDTSQSRSRSKEDLKKMYNKTTDHSPMMGKKDENALCFNILNDYRNALMNTSNAFENNGRI